MVYTHSKKLLLAISISLVLSGCGGGGGGGVTAAPGGGGGGVTAVPGGGGGGGAPLTLPEAEETSILSAQRLQDMRDDVEEKFEDIRISKPRPGSVSQSTNIDGNNVTQDVFNVAISGDKATPSYTIKYDEDANGVAEDTIIIDTANLKSDEYYEPVPESIFDNLVVGERREEDNRYFDGKDFDDGIIVIFTASNYDGDSDYVAAGLWLYVPGTVFIEEAALGAFADGETEFTDIANVTPGTARYEGGAFGFATLNHPSSGLQLAPFSTEGFDDVVLTATFGLDPSISGTITGLRNGILEEGSEIPGTIVLQRADIGGDTGFFTGPLGGTVGGIRLTGNWGGQFYGADGPQWVTGTAGGGGSTQDPESGENVDLNFVATYIAERE